MFIYVELKYKSLILWKQFDILIVWASKIDCVIEVWASSSDKMFARHYVNMSIPIWCYRLNISNKIYIEMDDRIFTDLCSLPWHG